MPNVFTDEQHAELQRIADFDHVFAVLPDGRAVETYHPDVQRAGGYSTLVDRARFAGHAPEALDVDPNSTELDDWQLPLSGLTGQHGYNGPWLHDSEQIRGGVAERVLSMPGYWVAIYAQHHDDAECPEGGECLYDIEGWTMAFKPFPFCEVCRCVKPLHDTYCPRQPGAFPTPPRPLTEN